jgi:hypothetical protein
VEREVKRATKKLLSPPLSTSFLNPEKISGLRKKLLTQVYNNL